jgi:hypothetical protein
MESLPGMSALGTSFKGELTTQLNAPYNGSLSNIIPSGVFALQPDFNLKFTNCIDGAVLRATLIRLLLAQITLKSDNAHLLVNLVMVSYAPRLESPQASRENSPT